MSVRVGTLRLIDQQIKNEFAEDMIVMDVAAQKFTYLLKATDLPAFGDDVALLFTSLHGVKAFNNCLSEKKAKKYTAFVIDGRTKTAAKDAGFQVIDAASYAADLAIKIIRRAPNTVYHFCAEDRLSTIEQALLNSKIIYTPIVSYKKSAVSFSFSEIPDTMAFFSPSQVDIYRSSDLPTFQTMFCIGETTANYLRKYYPQSDVIAAEQPTSTYLFNRIKQHYFEYIK